MPTTSAIHGACSNADAANRQRHTTVASEDTCECCGRPYDHRNPHRQSEMCDCVPNGDGTLSRPEEEDKNWNCPDCRRWFDEGKDNCKSCGFDLNSWNTCEVCEECGVPETDECRPDCAYQARRQREEEEEATRPAVPSAVFAPPLTSPTSHTDFH